jgi:hypothetical protein
MMIEMKVLTLIVYVTPIGGVVDRRLKHKHIRGAKARKYLMLVKLS